MKFEIPKQLGDSEGSGKSAVDQTNVVHKVEHWLKRHNEIREKGKQSSYKEPEIMICRRCGNRGFGEVSAAGRRRRTMELIEMIEQMERNSP